MYLSNIKLWNFRKYGSEDKDLSSEWKLVNPDLDLNFTEWLNVLIWANDSGKTAIIDAIKLVLKTNSYEWIKIENEDFYNDSIKLKIELTFKWLKVNFSRYFVEHLTIEWEWVDIKESLNLAFEVTRNKDRIFPSDVKAWINWELWVLSAEQRELLNVTYLKPLRDVKTEFIPKKGSRLSNILDEHKAFKWKWKTHELYKIFDSFNTEIEKYFVSEVNWDWDWIELKNSIDGYIDEFLNKWDKSKFSVNDWELKNILEKLKLSLDNNTNPWLWSLNRLFIASELLHLQREGYDWLELWLIEEIEAHIHPQAQMKVIESLQKRIKDKWIQLILTTHSPNLASKVKLENLIICSSFEKDSKFYPWAFPMWKEYTELDKDDEDINYRFLERFLDVTKSNLFFSNWVILVEWLAEEIILPTFVRLLKSLKYDNCIIWNDLTEAQVSIVNVWSDTFFRYAKIFQRKNEPYLAKNISIITDLDLRPESYKIIIDKKKKFTDQTSVDDRKKSYRKANIIDQFNTSEKTTIIENKTIKKQSIKTFLTKEQDWTLEYALANFSKFQEWLFESIKKAILEMRQDSTTYSAWEEPRTYWELKIEFSNDYEKLSFEIYANILLKKKVSKTIVAQYFSDFLEEEIKKIENNDADAFVKSDFEWDSSIAYLINAIKYATNQ